MHVLTIWLLIAQASGKPSSHLYQPTEITISQVTAITAPLHAMLNAARMSNMTDVMSCNMVMITDD